MVEEVPVMLSYGNVGGLRCFQLNKEHNSDLLGGLISHVRLTMI